MVHRARFAARAACPIVVRIDGERGTLVPCFLMSATVGCEKQGAYTPRSPDEFFDLLGRQFADQQLAAAEAHVVAVIQAILSVPQFVGDGKFVLSQKPKHQL